MEEIESLVAKVASGDAPAAERLAAFGEIVRRYQDMAYGCAYAVLGDFHLAEDAAQEAFLTAYRELRSLRQAGAFAGWLRRIVLSRCSRMTRRRSVSTTRLDAAATVASNEPGPTEAMEMRELKDKVLAAVRALPEPQRMVTTLFYINGYSQKDIAEFLEVPVTTVKKRLVASRGRLKQRMMVMVDETLKSFPLSGDFADIVVRKAGSAEDLQRAAALLGYSSRKRPQHFQSPAGADEAGLYVVGQEGAVEGAGYFNEFPLGIGGTVLTAARPNEMGAESVGVPDPAFVRSFRACFKLARERGIHLAACHGSQYDHAFCGFVPCFYYPVVTLPCEVGRSVDSGATLIEATAGQKEAAREAWLRDPYAPRMSAYLGGGAPHVVVQDGEVVGYARVDRDFRPTERHNMPFGHITDVTVRTRDAALAVIRVGAGLAEQGGQDKLWLMQSHRTRITRTMLSLGGTYLLRGPCDLPGLDAEMVAIVDLVGLTKELQGELEEIVDRKNRRGPLGFVIGGKDSALKKLTQIDEPRNDPGERDLVIIGTPVLAGTMAPAVRTYITRFKERLPRVAFFLTVGGTSVDGTFQDMGDLCGKEPLARLGLRTKQVRKEDWSAQLKEFVDRLKQG